MRMRHFEKKARSDNIGSSGLKDHCTTQNKIRDQNIFHRTHVLYYRIVKSMLPNVKRLWNGHLQLMEEVDEGGLGQCHIQFMT